MKPTETYVCRSASMSAVLLERAEAGSAASLCLPNAPRFELLGSSQRICQLPLTRGPEMGNLPYLGLLYKLLGGPACLYDLASFWAAAKDLPPLTHAEARQA